MARFAIKTVVRCISINTHTHKALFVICEVSTAHVTTKPFVFIVIVILRPSDWIYLNKKKYLLVIVLCVYRVCIILWADTIMAV